MKILSIRLKNLASLAGEHCIDFEAEPLASAGLIAIIGKTGAGKSTILDAMCLALFNKIPRLKESDGKLQDIDGSELATHSPLTVLRRGTAHGFAELTFVAQDQKVYLARWELKRSREKADGKLQSVQRYLKCLTDGVTVADKTKAVDSSIQKITQLTFEQFTRAVLLAQSEVTAFLKARDNERGELLEYLTDSAIFAKIGQLAFERTKSVALKRKELESLLGHIDLLTDEQVDELNKQFQQVDHSYKQQEAEKTQLALQHQWFERQHKLHVDIQEKQSVVDTQQKAQHDLSSEREQLTRLEFFSEIRSQVDQQQKLHIAKQQLAPKIQQQQSHFDLLQVCFNTQKAQFNQTEMTFNTAQAFDHQHHESLSHIRKYMQERDFLANEYKKISAKITLLIEDEKPLNTHAEALKLNIQQQTQQQFEIQQQLQHSQQFSSLDQALSTHLHQLKQFIAQYQNIENELGDPTQAKQRLTKYSTQLSQSITELGIIDQIEQQIIQLRQQRDQRFNQRTELEAIQQKLTQLFDLKDEHAQGEIKLNATTSKWQEIEQTTIEAEQNFQVAKDERLKLHAILQQQRLLHAENVENLRAELHDNEPCLVCGSTSHPYKTDDSALSKALFELQQQQEQQAIEKEQLSLSTWQTAQKMQTQIQTTLAQSKQTLQSLTEKISTAEVALTEQIKALNFSINLTQSHAEIHTQLHSIFQQYQDNLQQFDVQIQHFTQGIKQQQQLIQHIQTTEHLQQSAQHLQMQIQQILQCLSTDELQQWQNTPIRTAQQILERLNSRLQHLNTAERIHQTLEQDTQNQKNNQLKLEHVQQLILDAQQNAEHKKQQGISNNEKASALIQTFSGIKVEKPQEWLIEYDAKLQQAQQNYQTIKQSFEVLRQTFEQEKNQLDQLKAQREQNRQSAELVDLQIQQWLNLHTHFQMQDLNTLAQITPAQEQHIRQQLQTAERLLNDALTALKIMHEQLAEHQQRQPETDLAQLEQLIAQNAATLQTQQDLRENLKLQLEVHQQNINKQKQFANQIAEIQTEEYRWSKISGLMGDAHGKKFRDYAQQYNLDILLEHANQQLVMLSQRYTLKRLENSLSLAIIDHDMNDETRSVASLSGGESFLTALALSLAIANMASGSTKIESLFIDEGFGTLDASSLHMVMNALDQLQSQGRKVVLISHIQEMHERIPVQIQVRPLGAGASIIEVVS